MAIKRTVVTVLAKDIMIKYNCNGLGYNNTNNTLILYINSRDSYLLNEQETRELILSSADMPIDNKNITIEYYPDSGIDKCYWVVSLEENFNFLLKNNNENIS